MKNVLELDSVIQSFDGRQILTDVYLKCVTGDIIGVLGRNGSGKSTLLKILFGILSAERKFIRINDVVLQNPFLAKDLIVYMPQHNFLVSHLTLDKISRLFLSPEIVPQFFDDAILQRLRNSKAGELSGGESRYMEVKLLLSTPAQFVLLDEPFNGVAPVVVQQLKELIRSCSTDRGIILTDHDYKNVLDVANQYALLYDGGLKKIKDKQELVRWNYLTENHLD
jgi:lipopolysaccharide export system ATP-binding protein